MNAIESMAQRAALLRAFERNCECDRDDNNDVIRMCNLHEALADKEHKLIRHMEFVRTLTRQLVLEEWTVDSVPALIREWAA